MKKMFSYIWEHKIVTLIVLAILGTGGYFGYQKWFVVTETVRYITTPATKGILVSSLSGTGQVSAENQVDLKTKASGDVTYVGTKVGQEVKAGTLLVSLNTKDALKTVRDAESSLRSAQITYEKLVAPATDLEILQAENSLTSAKESRQAAIDDLAKSYEDGFNTVASTYLELPDIISGLDDIINSNDFEQYQLNIDWYVGEGVTYDNASEIKIKQYRQDVLDSYVLAKENYEKAFEAYKNSSRNSNTSTVFSLISDTYQATKDIAETVKNMSNLVNFVKNAMQQMDYRVTIPTLLITHQTSLSSYTSKTNSQLVALLSAKSSIESSKSSIESLDRSIAEKIISFEELKAGADALDIESQKLSLTQKENSLIDAKAELANYYVYAPFDGVIAAFDVVKGDSLSSGATVGTIITKQRVATISLNEVDAAKVKVGQKVNITFDAIDDLNITGEVAEVDTLGTVNSGVVSYDVTIVFDVQDDRIKSGMTATAVIILSSKMDVLMVKTSAIKIQGNQSYVEVLVNGVPEKKTVVFGDSNDTMTEIVSGLEENEEVVTQSVSTTKTTTSDSSSGGNSFRMGGPGM